MRIAITPMAYAPAIGGSHTYARGLAEALVARGHEVHVIVPDIDHGEAYFELGHRPTLLGDETLGGVQVHRIGMLRPRPPRFRRGDTGRELGRMRRVLRRTLRQALGNISPEVVVTLPHLIPNVEQTIALRERSGWSLVYAPHLHEEDPWWPVDRIREAVGKVDGLIALTTHEEALLATKYGADPTRIAVIPPGVAVPATVNRERREPIVLFVGRRAASKRVETLHDAMRLVWEEMPEAGFVVAGPRTTGPDEPAPDYESDPRVTVLDAVSPDERAALLDSCRVLASASVIESFGITTLEAWAHSVPVVVARTPVSESIVRHGVDGLLGDRTAEGLAEQLLRLLQDPDLAVRMGAAGRARAESEFTWERAGADLEELMNRTRRGRTAGPGVTDPH